MWHLNAAVVSIIIENLCTTKICKDNNINNITLFSRNSKHCTVWNSSSLRKSVMYGKEKNVKNTGHVEYHVTSEFLLREWRYLLNSNTSIPHVCCNEPVWDCIK